MPQRRRCQPKLAVYTYHSLAHIFCGMAAALFLLHTAARAEVLSIDETGTPHQLCALGRPTPARTTHTTVPATVPAAYAKAIAQASARYAISPDLLDAVAHQESNYNPSAISPKGAIGIMQLMPGTARILGVNPHDPTQNISGGAAYLRYLLDTFNGRIDLTLGAYNAGQNAIIAHGGLPPYPETRAYVAHSLAYLARISIPGTTQSYTPTCQ